MNEYTRLLLCTCLLVSCGHSDGSLVEEEREVITSVQLRFSPDSGGEAIVLEFDDPDGDGGEPPRVDELTLPSGIYELAIRFENRLETPAEDISVEIADEAEEHQVFLTGSALDGPTTDNRGAALIHEYGDRDSNGLPIGLVNTITAQSGAGELTVTLRHLPPLGNAIVKVSELSEMLRMSGFSGIGGASDVQVTFQVSVP